LSPEVAATVDRVRRAYGNHCFACGPDNPGGLHIEFLDLEADGTVMARFEARPQFRGALETLHGGIAATALDELLVWAGILGEGVMTVTGTLDLRYRRPLSVGGHIEGSARVLERQGRRLRVAGSLTVDTRPAVEAAGLYLVTAEVSDL
jgi:acyl-coenzyme A thioesterase PaaI-like protein